jgi:hypothetical protein
MRTVMDPIKNFGSISLLVLHKYKCVVIFFLIGGGTIDPLCLTLTKFDFTFAENIF